MCEDQALSIVFPWFPPPQHFRASQLKHISPQDDPMRVRSAVNIWDNNSLHNRKPRVKSLEPFRSDYENIDDTSDFQRSTFKFLINTTDLH